MKIFLSVILLYTVFFFTACGDDDNSPDATTPAEKDVYAAGVLIKDGVGRATWWKNGAETIVNDGTYASSAFAIWVDFRCVFVRNSIQRNKHCHLLEKWCRSFP
jgi:hypothetical protein